MSKEIKNENTEELKTEKTGVSETLSNEIDAGVKDITDTLAEDNKQEEPEEKEQVGDISREKEEPKEELKEEEEEEKEEGLSNEIKERAIKAGLSLSEVEKFSDPDQLEAMLGHIEKANPEKKKEETTEENSGFELPELDPTIYDDKIVEGFDIMKKFIREQQATIKELRGTKSEDWFNSQVTALGDDVSATLKKNPERANALREKFDMLQAGYKAVGKEVKRNEVFSEAVAGTIGDLIAKASKANKSEKLKKRGSQHISRPTNRDKRGDETNVFDETAAELDRKYSKD